MKEKENCQEKAKPTEKREGYKIIREYKNEFGVEELLDKLICSHANTGHSKGGLK